MQTFSWDYRCLKWLYYIGEALKLNDSLSWRLKNMETELIVHKVTG